MNYGGFLMKYDYKVGDYVTTYGGEEAKVEEAAEKCKLYDEISYRVEFTNKDLCPPTMWYPQHWLKPCDDPKDMKCPKCKTKWTETKLGNHVWRDCIPCGKKEEDITKELKDLPPIPEDDELDLEF